MSEDAKTRRFEFSDGGSDKFWSVRQDGKTLAIRFGRIGAAGQAQDKTFGSDDEAVKAAEKLIAEKIKKGYAEVGDVLPAPTNRGAEPLPARSSPPSPKQRGEEVAAVASSETLRPPASGGPVRNEPGWVPAPLGPAEVRIALDPEDWFRAPWRKLEPLPRPAVRPFDLQATLAKLAKLPTHRYGWYWEWDKAGLNHFMTPEEGTFWFTAMAEGTMQQESGKVTPKSVAEKLAAAPPSGLITSAQIHKVLNGTYQAMNAASLLLLLSQFSVLEIIQVLFDVEDEVYAAHAAQGGYRSAVYYRGTGGLLEGFQRWVRPFLTDAEVQTVQAFLRPRLDISQWPTDYYRTPRLVFPLAALFGLSAELRPLVESWKSDFYRAPSWDHTHYHRPQDIVFGLGSAEEVQTQMRRMNLAFKTAEDIRGWLAHTELSGLDYVKDVILTESNKDEAEKLLGVLALAEAPETAPIMLELMLSSRAPKPARRWLDTHTAHAVTGLLPLAGGRGKWADAAADFLRGVRRQGQEALIEAGLVNLSPEAAARVRSDVLADEDAVPFDDASTPDWLRDAMQSRLTAKFSWIKPGDLPSVTFGKQRLNDAQTLAFLTALASQKAPNDPPHPFVAAIKAHADAGALDGFGWRLFERWRSEGAPSKERWAMMAVGLLGGDQSALKLTPLIRVWPGESQHTRAVMGLEVLRAIGTDTALMQINGIAQKIPFKGLKASAVTCMEGIASDRKLTRAELEDRIVPDCDLSADGSRVFDFGPRSFRLVLGEGMKPLVKDGEGKVKPDLPKPNAKDDGAKAEAAVAEWKLLKKQVAEVAKTQAHRLEYAMVTGRRWTKTEFETLLVHHPLMVNLVRLLVWGVFDSDSGKLSASFRVTEDQTYADAADNLYALPDGATVGVVHPLMLSDADRSAWGEVFSDYELIPPFPQIGRATFALTPEEAASGTDITRFKDIVIPAASLVYSLDKLDWMRGLPADAGMFDEHTKPFYGANVTAVVKYDNGVAVGYITESEDQQMTEVCFIPGIVLPHEYWPDHKDRLPLSEIDPLVLSEVLADLSAVAAKGK